MLASMKLPLDADAGQSARLRLEHDEAEGFAHAGVDEEIGRVVVIGEFRVVLDVGAPRERAGLVPRGRQDAAERTVADDDEMVRVGMTRVQRLEGREQHFDIFLRRKAADVEQDFLVARQVEFLAQRVVPLHWMEGLRVDAKVERHRVGHAPIVQELPQVLRRHQASR